MDNILRREKAVNGAFQRPIPLGLAVRAPRLLLLPVQIQIPLIKMDLPFRPVVVDLKYMGDILPAFPLSQVADSICRSSLSPNPAKTAQADLGSGLTGEGPRPDGCLPCKGGRRGKLRRGGLIFFRGNCFSPFRPCAPEQLRLPLRGSGRQSLFSRLSSVCLL